MNNFPKANSFDINLVRSKIMGPNPLKLCEELPSTWWRSRPSCFEPHVQN